MDILEQYLNDTGMVEAAGEPFHDLLAGIETADQATEILPRALAQIRQLAGSETSQIVAARLLELTRQRENMLDTWSALARRFPANPLALRMHMRWLRRENRAAEGTVLLQTRHQSLPGPLRAELFAELDETEVSDALFEALIAASPDNTKTRLAFAKLLLNRSEIDRAATVLQLLRATENPAASTRQLLDRLDAALCTRKALVPFDPMGMNLPSAALHQSLLAFAGRILPPSASPHLGGITFLTGTLGAGGAERQLTRLACAMHARQQAGLPIAGARLCGPVEMVIANVSAAAGNDFFLPKVRQAGISLTVVSDIEPENLPDIGLPAGPVADLAAGLPKNARFGLQRLTAYFRRVRPEIAYIWQDGAVLLAALAALVAQVPRIVISLRGMPPNLRTNLAKDEFWGMYQALARIPGVAFSSNSRAAADAYAAWLNVPRAAFTVIYNAVDLESEVPDADELARWQAFTGENPPRRVTMGGVFRFNANKRPLLWVEFAAAALQRHPDMHFIAVGAGVMLEQAQQLARHLGCADRIFFAGHSHSVAFWLAQMDFVTLLSEFEGLPNVLIEAQLAGLPVISTPAGGATETFVAGRTGLVLNSARQPETADFLARLDQLLASPSRRRFMGNLARQRARDRFALDAILEQTALLFKGQSAPAGIIPLQLIRSA